MRQKRYPLLLDPSYPPERQVLNAVKSLPEGEQTGFLRALILLGDQVLKKERNQLQSNQNKADTDGTGTT